MTDLDLKKIHIVFNGQDTPPLKISQLLMLISSIV